MSVIGRLRGRSVGELTDRVRQAANARVERTPFARMLDLAPAPLSRLLPSDQPSSPDELLARFRARTTARSGMGFDDPARTAAAVHDLAPEECALVIRRAEAAANGRFDLLGYRGLSFGNPPDWHADPVAQRRAPLVHWSRVPYLDAAVVGDHKLVWELNRHQWIVTLAQAYALTGDERWARDAIRALEQWLDANPPKLGINWASSLEVAFRAISWLWTLELIRHSPSLTPAMYARLLESLHVHARHLETYLSTYFSPNTHLTGEALGLFYLGTLLPELRAASRWQRHGQRILEEQLAIHVHPDGVYFEQATQYHRYTTEFYVHLVALAEASGVALAPSVRPTLERLIDHLLHLARPDGTIPLFGDDDGGRLVQFDAHTPDDVRSLLAAGAVLFDRPDFAYAARGDLASATWLLGAETLERYERIFPAPPSDRARAFRDGGYYVTRSDWGIDADWLAFDSGPHGVMNGGHAHADALSFELAVGGRPVFVDSGTYTYSGSERNHFRGGAAHNTITVDDQSSSVPASGAFQWVQTARVEADAWHTSPQATYVSGSHDGFASLETPAHHRREILAISAGYWVVRDQVRSTGEHEIVMRLHCAPALAAYETAADATRHTVAVRSGPPDTETIVHAVVYGASGSLAIDDGWVSRQYGARDPAQTIVWRQRAVGDQEVITFLLPAGADRTPLDVRERADARGGRAFEILDGRARDLLLLGDGDSISADGVETDASWLWLRRDANGRIVEYLAVGATYGRTAHGDLWRPGERQAWRASAETGLGVTPVEFATVDFPDTGAGAS